MVKNSMYESTIKKTVIRRYRCALISLNRRENEIRKKKKEKTKPTLLLNPSGIQIEEIRI